MVPKLNKCFLIILTWMTKTVVLADVSVPMYFITPDGIDKPVGAILISETNYGLLFTPNLHNISPGIHGFHIHENASCAEGGMAAGGHLDPFKTGNTLAPIIITAT